MSFFEIINTDRLFIKTLSLQDKEAFLAYRSNDTVYKFQSWNPPSLQEVEYFIHQNLMVIPNTPNTWLQLGVYLHNSQLIGDIGLHFLEDGAQVEIGYTLAPEYQGQGCAFEAVNAILGYLFGQLGKHRVTASVDPDNVRSSRLLEKLGFRREGHFLQSVLIRGNWCDDVIYAMLEQEWKATR
ncbi:MAG: GNAT family N-acetyltransferase [Chloroflexi bacterium HGW-Chloroflexi-4]|jgi:RimJ/RimL family protein N-acetyltransferase|nr:MAG: GNAT family N-acetyltransferase [Chloroflexi bacterium HGW-Chloroflexi-4]